MLPILLCSNALLHVFRRYDERDIGGYFTDYLVTPWCRAGPYLIGLAVGIYLHRIKLKTSISMVSGANRHQKHS